MFHDAAQSLSAENPWQLQWLVGASSDMAKVPSAKPLLKAPEDWRTLSKQILPSHRTCRRPVNNVFRQLTCGTI